MRRWILLLIAVVLLALTWIGRRHVEGLRYVVPARGDLLYATTFDGGQFGEEWSQQDRRGGSILMTDDHLQLTFEPIVPAQQLLRSTTVYLFADFDYAVTASAVAGPLNNSFGIIFRQFDESTYYTFNISSDGFYSVWRETPELRWKVSDWIPSDLINLGAEGQNNTLRVQATGDTFRFFINGEAVDVCVPDSPDGESTYAGECIGGSMQPELVDATISYGALGVFVETLQDGGVSVQFDNALVVPPA